jgi:hypothetical protein
MYKYIYIYIYLYIYIHRDARLKSSRQNIVDGRVVSSDVVRGDQKALETFPEDANVMPKHVGATIHN